MKKIFAKLKNDQHVSIFDDAEIDSLKDLYKIPNVSLALPFDADSRPLADGEWYFLVLTEEQKEEMLGGYVTPGGREMSNPIAADNYPDVSVVYQVSEEGTLFTKATSRHVLPAKKYVTFDKKPVLVEQNPSLVLTGEVDAFWNGTRLCFKKFSYVRSLFPGIQKVFKELTEKETNEFLSSTMFELKDEMSSEFIGLRNRKRIAAVINAKTIDLASPEVYGKYIAYASRYDLDLEIDNGKIALIDNADISKVIDLFVENFYTSEITKEKREIRTSKKLVHGKRKRAR